MNSYIYNYYKWKKKSNEFGKKIVPLEPKRQIILNVEHYSFQDYVR